MRILHVITMLDIGGAERLLVDLLPLLQEKGYDVLAMEYIYGFKNSSEFVAEFIQVFLKKLLLDSVIHVCEQRLGV